VCRHTIKRYRTKYPAFTSQSAGFFMERKSIQNKKGLYKNKEKNSYLSFPIMVMIFANIALLTQHYFSALLILFSALIFYFVDKNFQS